MSELQNRIKTVTSLDTAEIRSLSRQHLERHGITNEVISEEEKNRGVLLMSGDQDLISFLVSHPDWVKAIFWAAAFRIGLGKVVDGFLEEIGKDLYSWLKDSIKATMRRVRLPERRATNPRARVLVRFEGKLLIDSELTDIVVRLNYYPSETDAAQSLEKISSDAAVSEMIDLVFGNVLSFAIEASRLCPKEEKEKNLHIEVYVPPQDGIDIFIMVGQLFSLCLDVQGNMTVHGIASAKTSRKMTKLFSSFKRQSHT